MKTRAKSFSIFQKCHAKVRTQFNISICILRSDNVKEYLFGPFSSFLSSHEILHQPSCTYTPQQNGVVECKNRHLVKTVRTLLLHHKVPQRFLGDNNLADCYLINRMSSSVLHYLIPFFFQTNLSSAFPLVSLVVFVLSIFLLLDKTSFQPKPRSVFLSYSRLQQGYHCYSLDTHQYFVSVDVTFFENSSIFPINHPSSSDVIALPFFISSRIPHMYLRLLHFDHFRLILVARILTLSLRLTHLLWHPPP